MVKYLSLRSILSAVLIATITSFWVYLISDNPIKIIFSLLIGVSCGTVTFFIFTDEVFTIQINKPRLSTSKILLFLFLLFLLTYFVLPVNGVFVFNWFSLGFFNWFSLILALFFTFYASGFIIINLLGVHSRVPFSASVVFSVLVSMFSTSVIWFFAKYLSLPNNLSFSSFALFQFILIFLYGLKSRNASKPTPIFEKKTLRLNVIVPLLAVIAIFVLFIVLQEFVYEPFIRGDSWTYIGNSLAISKGIFSTLPTGWFYMGPAHFFDLFLSALASLSGFPPVNSLMVFSVVFAVLFPLAFYVMARKYSANWKQSILATFVFVLASGFGWLPFVSQKLAHGSSYSPSQFLTAINTFAPKVLNDITQPQGVFSEGLKTYAFGLLAIFVLLFLFRSDLPSKLRIVLIAVTIAFAFEYHIEEALIFTVAIVPAFLIIFRKAKDLRANLVGLAVGFIAVLLFNVLVANVSIRNIIFETLVVSLAVLGFYIGLSFINFNVKNLLKSVLGKYKLQVCLVFVYIFFLAVYTLLVFGYPNMSPSYSSSIVAFGSAFPWYYYPMALGVMGILLLAGFLLNFEKNRNISLVLLIIIFLIAFGALLSFFNAYVFPTATTREWRIIYRIIPMVSSLFAGWVIFKLVDLKQQGYTFKLRIIRKTTLRINRSIVSVIILLFIIILCIPSTLLASEYWMSSSVSPYGDLHPSADDIGLVNFIYHIPASSRVAVAEMNSNSDALVHLAGGITDTYPNLNKLDRPETLALLSENDRYFIIDKTQGFNAQTFSSLDTLPVAFNNSKYIVYELPIMQPSSLGSNIGYVAPLEYNNITLQSYSILSSLNISYQLVNDDIYGKSVLLLPSELPGQSVLNFDGVNQDADIENFNLTTNDFSCSAWFKTSALGSDMSLVNDRLSGSSHAGFRIMILDNLICAEVNDGSGTVAVSGAAHTDGLWHNVIAVLDQKYLSIYVDGKLEGITSLSKPIGSLSNQLNLTLGSDNGKDFFFNGSLSNVCIYDRALSENEITSQTLSFDSYISKVGLRLWLPINEGAGNQLYDGFTHSSVGIVRGATWSIEDIPSDVSYVLDTNSMINWVKTGGRLVIFGGKGELNSILGINDTNQYVTANAINSGNSGFQLNPTVNLSVIVYPANGKVLGYYQYNGENVCSFAVEATVGQGSVLYLYLDPIYHINRGVQESLIFDSAFLSMVNQAIDGWGIGNYTIVNSQQLLGQDYAVNQWPGHIDKNFAAQGNIEIDSSLSGSYLAPMAFLADKVTLSQNSGEYSFENLPIESVSVDGNANLSIRAEALSCITNKNSIPTYLPVQLTNCSATIEPVDGSNVELQTAKGSIIVSSGESVTFDSSLISLVIKNPSINVNGTTNLTLKTSSTTQFEGQTFLNLTYNDNNYLFFDKLTLPTVQSNSLQQYSLPWVDVFLSPFSLLLLCVLVFLYLKLRKTSALNLSHDCCSIFLWRIRVIKATSFLGFITGVIIKIRV